MKSEISSRVDTLKLRALCKGTRIEGRDEVGVREVERGEEYKIGGVDLVGGGKRSRREKGII